jgi:hypothetical protein
LGWVSVFWAAERRVARLLELRLRRASRIAPGHGEAGLRLADLRRQRLALLLQALEAA